MKAQDWPTSLASATIEVNVRVRVRVFGIDLLVGLVAKMEAVRESERNGTNAQQRQTHLPSHFHDVTPPWLELKACKLAWHRRT